MEERQRDPIAAQGASFATRYLEADDGVRLRTFHWQPRHPETDRSVVFVAGWFSHVSGWADLLQPMAARMPVHYIETREKPSARLERKRLRVADFTLRRVARDLVNVCRSLPVSMPDALIVGSSFGATGLLEALKKGKMTARGAFLVGPNSEFRAHPLLQKLPHLPAASYPVIKYFALWYLRTFRVDAKREPEQMRRYELTLKSAHPLRTKLSVRAALGYEIWNELETVAIPTALACAPTDTLHSHENIQRMAAILPRGQIVACPTNRYMHSARLLDDIEGFAARIQGAPFDVPGINTKATQ